MNNTNHAPPDILEAGVEAIQQSPKATGVLELIVLRPDVGLRETPGEARLVNSPSGRELRLRGANARIVTGGLIRIGAPIEKL